MIESKTAVMKHIPMKPNLILAAFLITCLIIWLYAGDWTIILKHHQYSLRNQHGQYLSTKTSNQSQNKRIILYWNNFFSRNDMGFGFGDDIFKNCPINNCYATNNRNLMDIQSYDAIIFHGVQYSSSKDGIPQNRSSHQKYIFFSLESPYNTNFDKKMNENFYNWTMTYRRDSDIYRPYGIIQQLKTNYTLPDINKIRGKKKMVAWFVSNCAEKGTERRRKYVKELSKYVPVHIYGKCGNYSCPRNKNEKCKEMLGQEYKFYLSFENSICAEYITEKVFGILSYDIIPVVLGNNDYKKILPHKSVIDVNDFDSPQDLAKYLYELEANYEKYVEYFQWKKNFVVNYEHPLCQMCELLNKPLKHTLYSDIEDWFYGFKCYQ